MTQPIPDGYHSITPYLYVPSAAEAIDFYTQAFGATELQRLETGDGAVMHAEIRIGNSVIMLSDENPEMGGPSPKTLGGHTSSLLVYTEDCDALYAQAVAAGADATRPVELQFWGDRMGAVTDPFGHQWSLATHVEDVTPEEADRRFAELMQQMGS